MVEGAKSPRSKVLAITRVLQVDLDQVAAVVGVEDSGTEDVTVRIGEPQGHVVGTGRLLRIPDRSVTHGHDTADQEPIIRASTSRHSELKLDHATVPSVLRVPRRRVEVGPATVEAALCAGGCCVVAHPAPATELPVEVSAREIERGCGDHLDVHDRHWVAAPSASAAVSYPDALIAAAPVAAGAITGGSATVADLRVLTRAAGAAPVVGAHVVVRTRRRCVAAVRCAATHVALVRRTSIDIVACVPRSLADPVALVGVVVRAQVLVVARA